MKRFLHNVWIGFTAASLWLYCLFMAIVVFSLAVPFLVLAGMLAAACLLLKLLLDARQAWRVATGPRRRF